MAKWTVPEPLLQKGRSDLLLYCEQIKRQTKHLRGNPYPKSKDDISVSIDHIVEQIKEILK